MGRADEPRPRNAGTSASLIPAGTTRHLLFVCTGNTGRSLTAAALARLHAASAQMNLVVVSRGLAVDARHMAAEPRAAALLLQAGVDVSAHRAVTLAEADIAAADLIIAMTAAHLAEIAARFPDSTGRAFTLMDYATGRQADVVDAFGQDRAAYRAMFDQIGRSMPDLLRKFTASALN